MKVDDLLERFDEESANIRDKKRRESLEKYRKHQVFLEKARKVIDEIVYSVMKRVCDEVESKGHCCSLGPFQPRNGWRLIAGTEMEGWTLRILPRNMRTSQGEELKDAPSISFFVCDIAENIGLDMDLGFPGEDDMHRLFESLDMRGGLMEVDAVTESVVEDGIGRFLKRVFDKALDFERDIWIHA